MSISKTQDRKEAFRAACKSAQELARQHNLHKLKTNPCIGYFSGYLNVGMGYGYSLITPVNYHKCQSCNDRAHENARRISRQYKSSDENYRISIITSIFSKRVSGLSSNESDDLIRANVDLLLKTCPQLIKAAEYGDMDGFVGSYCGSYMTGVTDASDDYRQTIFSAFHEEGPQCTSCRDEFVAGIRKELPALIDTEIERYNFDKRVLLTAKTMLSYYQKQQAKKASSSQKQLRHD